MGLDKIVGGFRFEQSLAQSGFIRRISFSYTHVLCSPFRSVLVVERNPVKFKRDHVVLVPLSFSMQGLGLDKILGGLDLNNFLPGPGSYLVQGQFSPTLLYSTVQSD